MQRLHGTFSKYKEKDTRALKSETYAIFVCVSMFPFASCVCTYGYVCMPVYMCLCAHLYYTFMSRSGTDEGYTALQQLFEDISVYMKDFAAANDVHKGLNKKKAEEDKKKGAEMRKAVMEGIASMYISYYCCV